MDNKQKLKDFLTTNWEKIEKQRQEKSFTWTLVAEEFHKLTNLYLSSEYIRGVHRTLRDKVSTTVYSKHPSVNKTEEKYHLNTSVENKDKGTKQFTFTASEIPTEQDIITHFNIDLTKYRINQIYHKTSFGGKYSITVSLLAVKGVEALNYEKKFAKFVEKYNEKILQNPSKDTAELEKSHSEKCCYLISMADLHIGNYQKPNYLEDITEKVRYTLYAAMQHNVDEVIILNTGDMLHTDTSKAQTWNNTQLDAQDTFEDAFSNGLDFVTNIIDYSRELGLKTTFVNVRGNHSFDTEYCLGEALKKVYKFDSKIKILNSKDTRLYYTWENNGFLFTHGDKGMDRLPLLFATEGKETFTETEHHHILLGHLHHNKGKQFINDRGEFAGIEVRVLGSPTSNDIWHKQNGFCQNKKAIQCMLFTPSQGKYAEYNFKM